MDTKNPRMNANGHEASTNGRECTRSIHEWTQMDTKNKGRLFFAFFPLFAFISVHLWFQSLAQARPAHAKEGSGVLALHSIIRP